VLGVQAPALLEANKRIQALIEELSDATLRIAELEVSTPHDSARLDRSQNQYRRTTLRALGQRLGLMKKLRIGLVEDFGWEIRSRGRSRSPPISLSTTVARTEGFTYAMKVWALRWLGGCPSRTILCHPTPQRYDSQLVHRCAR
jgi:hypothetical protein